MIPLRSEEASRSTAGQGVDGVCEDAGPSVIWLCLKNFMESVAGTRLKMMLRTRRDLGYMRSA